MSYRRSLALGFVSLTAVASLVGAGMTVSRDDVERHDRLDPYQRMTEVMRVQQQSPRMANLMQGSQWQPMFADGYIGQLEAHQEELDRMLARR